MDTAKDTQMNFDFCPTLAEMFETGRTIGQSGKVFSPLGALSTQNNLLVLREIMRKHGPTTSLEVGLSFGGSALAIASSHRELGHVPKQQHIALDPYQHSFGDWGWDNAGLLALDRAGLKDFVEHRSELSSIALPQLLREGRQFGLIYVDGSHFFDDVFVDAYFGLRLLTDDGFVLFDDSSTKHVAKVLSFICTNWRGWTEEVDLTPYHPNGHSLRYGIARHLKRTQLRAFHRTGKDPRAWDAPLVRF